MKRRIEAWAVVTVDGVTTFWATKEKARDWAYGLAGASVVKLVPHLPTADAVYRAARTWLSLPPGEGDVGLTHAIARHERALARGKK